MRRSSKAIIGAAVALVIAWYFASPYYVLHKMKSAVENRNPEELSSYIDFPALKENIKASFSAKVMAETAKTPKDQPFAAAGSAFALMMIGPMIDAMVTPQGVARMMRGEKPRKSQSDSQSQAPSTEPKISTSYQDLNTFSLTISDSKSPDQSLKLILKRQGMFTWKLSSAELPM